MDIKLRVYIIVCVPTLEPKYQASRTTPFRAKRASIVVAMSNRL